MAGLAALWGVPKSKQSKDSLNEPMNELERWTNFYLLMSAASATLVGLLFVVITLAAERRLEGKSKIPIYLTPTVIYFVSVLFLTALLTFPNHTQLTAALCICVVGAVGAVYSGSFFVRRGVRKSYYDQRDWIAYAAFPLAAYSLLAGGGVLALYVPQRGLTLVAAGMLSLLAIAIRNSWAIAVSVVSTPPGQRVSK
jgi:hypothetical protein